VNPFASISQDVISSNIPAIIGSTGITPSNRNFNAFVTTSISTLDDIANKLDLPNVAQKAKDTGTIKSLITEQKKLRKVVEQSSKAGLRGGGVSGGSLNIVAPPSIARTQEVAQIFERRNNL